MIAGRLNEVINILTPMEVINEYGERKTTLKKTYTTRARVEFNNGSRRNENDEIVFDYSKTFTTYPYVPVVETSVIEWQKKQYRILTIEYRREYNELIINTELINE